MIEVLDDDNSSERRATRKRLRKNGSQTDKELDMEGNHCCEASANMRRMEAKIDQILTFLPEMEALKVRLAKVEEENKQLRNTADSTETELTDLKQSLTSTCSQVASNSDELQKLNIEVQQLRCRNIKLEAYTHRENIKIFNLPEIAGETPGDTENVRRKDEDSEGRC